MTAKASRPSRSATAPKTSAKGQELARLQRAADKARAAFEYGEAIQHYDAVLALGQSSRGLLTAAQEYDLLMALSVTLLRAEARRFDSPAEVLQAVNRELMAVNDTGRFVTALYGILDDSSGTFHYARAGHSLPLVVDAGRQPVEVGHGVGQPLGLFEELLLDEATLDFTPGSLMLLFTDGVTEAVNPQGEFFGDERLLATVRSSDGAGPERTCETVWGALQAYQAGASQEDDVTLLAVGVH